MLLYYLLFYKWIYNDSLSSIKVIYGIFKLVLKLQIAYKDRSSNSFATTLLQKWNLVETTLMWKKIDSRQSRFKNIQLEGAYSERVVLKSLLSRPTIIFRWNTLCHLEIIIAWKFKIWLRVSILITISKPSINLQLRQ